MPLIPMHPSLSAVYKHFDCHYGLTGLNVNQYSDAEDLLVNIIIDNLEFQKPTLVVTGSDQDPAWIAKVLSKYELSKYCLVWTPSYIGQQKPLERISNFNSDPSEFDKDKHRILRNEVEDLQGMIKESLIGLGESVMSTTTWYDLLQKWCQLQISSDQEYQGITQNWNDFNYSQYIFTIGEAEFDFKTEFILLHELSPFHNDVYSHDFEIDSLKDELTSRHEEILELSQSIHEQYIKIKGNLSQEVYNYYSKISKASQRLERHAIRLNARVKGIEGENRNFADVCSVMEFHAIEDLIETLESSIRHDDYIHFDWPSENRLKWSLKDLNQFISELVKEIHGLKGGLEQKINEKLRRLGSHNAGNHALQLLDEQLEEYVIELNSSDLFSKKYINNSLNIQRKIELIKSIQNDIHRSIVFLESHPEYFEWRSSVRKDQQETILKELSFKDETWKSAMAKTLICSCLYDHFDPQLLTIGEDIQLLVEKNSELIKSSLDNIHYLLQSNRSNELKNSKKEDQYALHQVINKSSTASGTFELFTNYSQLFRSFFPVLIVTEKDYNELVPHLDESLWNSVIALDSEVNEGSKSVLALTTQKEGIDSYEFDYFLEDYKKINHLKSIAVTKRYDDAVKVSKMIMSLTPHVSIYQMRDTSIISCLSDELEDLVSMEFIPQGIKCLHRNTSSIEGITEVILNGEVEFFLWIENGFIGGIDSEHILWHQDLLKTLEKIGIKVQNFESVALFTDRGALLKSVRQSILGAGTQKPIGAVYADS
jgi:hypothetical protein